MFTPADISRSGKLVSLSSHRKFDKQHFHALLFVMLTIGMQLTRPLSEDSKSVSTCLKYAVYQISARMDAINLVSLLESPAWADQLPER